MIAPEREAGKHRQGSLQKLLGVDQLRFRNLQIFCRAEDALLGALKKGQIVGAALDVFATEPIGGKADVRWSARNFAF